MNGSGVIKCLSCGKEFEDYQELALHISSERKGHRKGKKWAAKYIHRHLKNKREYDNNGRVSLTVEQKANKEDTRRGLSGEQRVAETICLSCKRVNRVALESEYVSSPQAWRIQGKLVKMCASCGG
jgi:hypothetical protein